MGGYGLNNIHTHSCKTEDQQQRSIFFEWSLDKFNVYFSDKTAQKFFPFPSKQYQWDDICAFTNKEVLPFWSLQHAISGREGKKICGSG